jgi:TrpR-related protein YerC/YecD
VKRRPPAIANTNPLEQLCAALLAVRDVPGMRALLTDLCTPAELEAMADRWQVVPLLLEQRPYREIHELTGVSVTTIARVARCLSHGSGGYHAAARHLGLPRHAA